jgi:hypothetical protein
MGEPGWTAHSEPPGAAADTRRDPEQHADRTEIGGNMLMDAEL